MLLIYECYLGMFDSLLPCVLILGGFLIHEIQGVPTSHETHGRDIYAVKHKNVLNWLNIKCLNM